MRFKQNAILTGVLSLVFYKVILPGFFVPNSSLVMAALFASLLLLWVVFKIWSQKDAFQIGTITQATSEVTPSNINAGNLGDDTGTVQKNNEQI